MQRHVICTINYNYYYMHMYSWYIYIYVHTHTRVQVCGVRRTSLTRALICEGSVHATTGRMCDDECVRILWFVCTVMYTAVRYVCM